jgi:hypothetical protein
VKRLQTGEAKAENGLWPRSVDATHALLMELNEPFFGVTFKNWSIVNVVQV